MSLKPRQPKDVICIEGPVWCGEYQVAGKGRRVTINVTKETDTEIEGTLMGATPLKICIAKDKYQYKELTV